MRQLAALFFAAWMFATGFAAGVYWQDSPGPEPGPAPTPTPDVAPIESDDLVVLILEETENRKDLTADQLAVLQGVQVRKWLDDAKAKYRIWDTDTDLKFEAAFWQQAVQIAKQKANGKYPYLFVSNGRRAGGAAVSSVADAIRLLEEYRRAD